jgi:arylsulfatase A-like enzyme
LLVSNPSLKAKTLHTPVATMQVAPTVLALLGLNPQALEGVRAEGTEVLPELNYGRSEH